MEILDSMYLNTLISADERTWPIEYSTTLTLGLYDMEKNKWLGMTFLVLLKGVMLTGKGWFIKLKLGMLGRSFSCIKCLMCNLESCNLISSMQFKSQEWWRGFLQPVLGNQTQKVPRSRKR